MKSRGRNVRRRGFIRGGISLKEQGIRCDRRYDADLAGRRRLVQEENGGCCGLSAVEDARRVAADWAFLIM